MATGDATVRLSRLGESATPEAEIPMQIGSVRLVREIGRGGMGVVWLARHEILGRDVAVKFVLSAAGATTTQPPGEPREPTPSPPDAKTTPIPAATGTVESGGGGADAGASAGVAGSRADADLPGNEMQAFIEGCRAAAAVRHPGLVEVYHADIVNRIPYLVMEYVDGPSLEGAIRRLGALSVPLALAIMEVTCDAVASLHDAGIIHRDIKPANLLITAEGQVEVTDFGLACERPAGKGHESVGLAGTPAYMAPEMFEGSISLKSDVYALGITLFEMLTGTVPYDGNLTALQNHHRASPLPIDLLKIKQVPPAIIEVIERTTAKNPMLRSRTARHVVQALRLAVRDERTWAQGKRELATLVSRWRSAAADEAREGASDQGQETYYDHLSMRAERKRKFTPAPLEPGIAPLTPLSPSDDDLLQPIGGGSGAPAEHPGRIAAGSTPAQEQSTAHSGETAASHAADPTRVPAAGAIMQGRLARHICCARCAYDLFAQPEQGICPECGEPVRESLSPERLAFADLAWLNRVQSGFRVLLASLAIGTVLILLVSSSAAIESLHESSRAIAVVELLGTLASAALLTFAGFRATPAETETVKHASTRARLAARGGLIVACATILADTIRRAIGGEPPFATAQPAVGFAGSAIAFLMIAGWMTATSGFVAYAASMVRTIPDAVLAARARLLHAAAILIALMMPLFYWLTSGKVSISAPLMLSFMFMLLVALALPCGLFAYVWACRREVQRVIDPVKHPTPVRRPKFDDE